MILLHEVIVDGEAVVDIWISLLSLEGLEPLEGCLLRWDTKFLLIEKDDCAKSDLCFNIFRVESNSFFQEDHDTLHYLCLLNPILGDIFDEGVREPCLLSLHPVLLDGGPVESK